MLLSMTSLPYQYGIKMRCFPSFRQQRLITQNIIGAQFAYNEAVTINNELHQLKQVKCYVKIVAERINYLLKLKNNSPTQQLRNLHPLSKRNRNRRD